MNKVDKARRKFLKTLKDLREGKIDLDKIPIPGISGELKGNSEMKYCGICGKKWNGETPHIHSRLGMFNQYTVKPISEK